MSSPFEAGPNFAANAFAADTGAADPDLRRALAAVVGVRPGPALDEAEAALLAVLGAARFLLPVVAAPPAVAQAWQREGHHDHDHEHDHHEHDDHGHEAEADVGAAAMAAVRLVAPDGRQGLPVFTGLDALTGWNGDARPLPMASADAARMALDEGCDVLIVDLGQSHAHVLRSSMVWALAQERPWVPPHRDDAVLAAIGAGAASIDGVVAAAGAPCGDADDPGTLVVELTLEPGLTAGQVQTAATALGERLAEDPAVRSRLDGVRFVLRRA